MKPANASKIIGGAAFIVVPLAFLLVPRGAVGQKADDAEATSDATASYLAELAARDAAALQWQVALEDSFEECPDGTAFWLRDRITPMCATVCTSDVDCGGIEGRCRVLDPDSQERAPEVLLLDDMSPDEADRLLAADATTSGAAVTVCDPFWDFEGALDIDVVEVVE